MVRLLYTSLFNVILNSYDIHISGNAKKHKTSDF